MATPNSLDLDRATMRRLGHRVADIVADHLASLREQPVLTGLGRRATDAALGRPAPRDGSDFEALVTTLQRDVFSQHAREPHPGFMAYVPSCPTYPAVLG